MTNRQQPITTTVYRGVNLRAQNEIQGQSHLNRNNHGEGGRRPPPHPYYLLIGFGPGFHSGQGLALCLVVIGCCLFVADRPATAALKHQAAAASAATDAPAPKPASTSRAATRTFGRR